MTPQMIDLQQLLGQRPTVPEMTALSSDQAARIAELAAAARSYQLDQRGRPVDNAWITVQAVPATTRHLIAATTKLPKPGSDDPTREVELIERLIDRDGTLLYDDLEGYLERQAERA